MGICATCGSDQEYRIQIDEGGVPHGSPGHQITYRWTNLYVCLRCGAGVLAHFDHDCFAPPYDEPWDMNWRWPVTVQDVQRLEAVLTRCPDPTRGACVCPVHRSLRASDQASRAPDATATILLTEDELPELCFRT
ncbi:hypothetical protein [Micromonospora sp. NPDC126480]|uniref:hypothetical protein n=1 Tax=Micromonospora sp. NPDC126480 TaxID=3155312 RepID=UPI00331C9BF0